jgi:hypothetical protein
MSTSKYSKLIIISTSWLVDEVAKGSNGSIY